MRYIVGINVCRISYHRDLLRAERAMRRLAGYNPGRIVRIYDTTTQMFCGEHMIVITHRVGIHNATHCAYHYLYIGRNNIDLIDRREQYAVHISDREIFLTTSAVYKHRDG